MFFFEKKEYKEPMWPLQLMVGSVICVAWYFDLWAVMVCTLALYMRVKTLR